MSESDDGELSGKAMNGTYGFVYSGLIGIGLGIFRITDTKLVGVDFSGVRYRGTAIPDSSGMIHLTIDMTVPTGVFLVQGVSAQDLPYTRSFSIVLAPDFGDGKPVKVDIPPSHAWLMIQRVPDEWAPYADGVIVDIRPITAAPAAAM